MKSMLPQADFLVAWERAVSVPAWKVVPEKRVLSLLEGKRCQRALCRFLEGKSSRGVVILSGQKEPGTRWICVKAKTFPRLPCSYDNHVTVLINM